MKSREAVLEALHEGKYLISSITGLQYTLINNVLHARNSERAAWNESELGFDHPPSWLNLRIVEEKPTDL